MQQFKIEYVQREGDPKPVLLLSERQRARLEEGIRLAEEQADGTVSTLLAKLELEADARLRAEQTVKIAVFESRDGTLRDQLELRTADVLEQRIKAYELLKPELRSGWEGAVPLEMQDELADRCVQAVFPSQSEDRRFF